MNLKITFFELIFIFNFILIFIHGLDLNFEKHNSLLLTGHNVNTTFYKYVLSHPAKSLLLLSLYLQLTEKKRNVILGHPIK